jgi:hypothetical protein
MPHTETTEQPGRGLCAGRRRDRASDTHTVQQVKAQHQPDASQEVMLGVGRGGRPRGGGRGHCHGGNQGHGKGREMPLVTG